MADDVNTVELATELTIAWLGNHNTRVQPDDVPGFLRSMHDAIAGLSTAAAPKAVAPAPAPTPDYAPAVTVRKSLGSPDHIISMIDGKPYKTLRRHLSSNGLTPDEYRKRYGLKPDYPMVAPAYSEHRRSMAHKIGLGRKSTQDVAPVAKEAPAPAPVKRGRKSVTEARQAAQAHLGSTD